MTFIVTMAINTVFWVLVAIVFLCLVRFKMKDEQIGYKETLMQITTLKHQEAEMAESELQTSQLMLERMRSEDHSISTMNEINRTKSDIMSLDPPPKKRGWSTLFRKS